VYNPGVDRALLRTAQITAEDIDFLDDSVAAVWGETVQEEGDTIVLDKKKFLALSPALQRNLLRLAIERLLGNIRDIEMRHIEGVMTTLHKPAGRRLDLPSGLIFTIDYDSYYLVRDEAALYPFPVLEGEAALRIPGETRLPGWLVKAEVVSTSGVEESGEYRVYLDFDRVGERLTVRPRRPGDRFQPLGMDSTKRLNEFMIDAKISRPWRGRVPLVCSPAHIVWVVGWRLDERVRVTGNTRRVLCLEFVRA
jgi:tRNA(Ile)-lysidine synthase